MLNRTCKSLLLAISALALLLCGATKAPAQGYELRCRGGADAFAIDKLDANTLALNVKASKSAARANGSGLVSGTCCWIDRTVSDQEPRQIHFSPIRTYLKEIV